MAPLRSWAALAALGLASLAQAWHNEEPPCPSEYAPFEYSGCYADADGNSLVYRSSETSDDMTVEKCSAICKGNGFAHSGLKYYGICYCGNVIEGAQLDESQCSHPCNGDRDQVCGGDNSLSVYSDPTFPDPALVDEDDYVDIGCWSDDSTVGRTLSWPQDQLSSSQMTPQLCIAACKAGGFPHAGVEFGGECWCGALKASDARSVEAGECAMSCNGDSSQTCGGRSRIQLYLAVGFQSLEPCGEGQEPEPPVSSAAPSASPTPSSSAVVSSAAPSQPPSTFSSVVLPPTTTEVPAVCTTEVVFPPTTEYCCGRWCSEPIPEFNNKAGCLVAKGKCVLQTAACLATAGWPGTLECLKFGQWCAELGSYCLTTCKPGRDCSRGDFLSKKPPKGGVKPPTTSTSTVPCPETTAAATPTTPHTPAPTPVVPEPTSVCVQAKNGLKGYGPGNPVGGIEMPFVTCNDVEAEFHSGYHFKQYLFANTLRCPTYKRSQVKGACVDACHEQGETCRNVYAKAQLETKGFTAWVKATALCKVQQEDCLKQNKNVSGGSHCTTFGRF
ncbi:WSC-domain-containing protein [Sodiomyces alkalinus F11]|uniref:WSC-domain-containing protein n=1 Tax=Sodiomyces alkalinus (strain CBS 110278 / VKM F-3762 / F11) TaxID=1314773 RepID=A0A3N2Q199_SODAK|nr:WSC-domain-containing protein [Sodiomyces alkalinus F11]ROT40395.1 WSC-domain-containing protein [Sodiomyces alkalinus F11]